MRIQDHIRGSYYYVLIIEMLLVSRKVLIRREVTFVHVFKGKQETDTGGIACLNVQKRKHA